MNLNCTFLSSCITTTKKDSTGYGTGFLLKYLLNKQNKILEKIKVLDSFKNTIIETENFMKL